jgi:ankyrin repeat protein
MAAAEVSFCDMSEAALRRWVEVNPGSVNDRDRSGFAPLYKAVEFPEGLPLVLWLLDEKGADVNSGTSFGDTPLHAALSLDVVHALLDRGADPTM